MSNLTFLYSYDYFGATNIVYSTLPQNTNSFFSSDAILSALITTLIFVIGIFINVLLKKHEKRNELVLYKKLITSWVESTKISIDKYISSLNKFATDIKENDSLNIAQYTTNLICLDRLNSLPIDKITDALIINIKTKLNNNDPIVNMYNLLTQIEFIEKNSFEIRSLYEKYCIENQKIMDEWNDSYLKFINTMKAFNDNHSEKELIFAEKIHELIVPIIQIQTVTPLEEYPISKWKTNFVEPVMSFFTSDDEFILSDKIVTTVNYISILRIAILKHEKLNTFGDVFKEASQRMENSKVIMLKSCKFFTDNNIKNTLYIK